METKSLSKIVNVYRIQSDRYGMETLTGVVDKLPVKIQSDRYGMETSLPFPV